MAKGGAAQGLGWLVDGAEAVGALQQDLHMGPLLRIQSLYPLHSVVSLTVCQEAWSYGLSTLIEGALACSSAKGLDGQLQCTTVDRQNPASA